MSELSVYISHSIRGYKGDKATTEDMELNNKIAIEFATLLSLKFPKINFYCPAVGDEFVTLALDLGLINVDEVLDIDCKILAKRNLLLIYSHDSRISSGMWTETRYAQKNRTPVKIVQNLQTAEIALNNWLEQIKEG